MLLNRSRLRTLAQKVRSLFSRLSPSGHMYIGGAGGVVTNGFQPGNYVESTGSTYASTDYPVGLVLDAAGSVGSELATAWTPSAQFTQSGNVIIFTGVNGAATSNSVPVIGKTYRVTFDHNITAGNVQPVVGGVSLPAVIAPSVGSKSYIIAATETTANYIYSNSGQGAITNFSIKEITGIHSSQATVGSKPMLRKGIVNLLTNSGDLSTWVGGNRSLTYGIADPLGGNAATTVTATAANGEIYRTVAASGTHTTAIWIRRRTGSGVVSIRNSANSAWIPFSLTTDWAIVVNDSGSVAATAYVDILIETSGDAVDIFRGGCFTGTLTAAQIQQYGGISLTTTVAASSSLGPQYLAFDGVDDRLTLSAAAFQMADDHCVVATIKSLTGGTDVFSLTNDAATAFIRMRLSGDGSASAWWKDDAGAQSLLYATNILNQVCILTIRKVGNRKSVRLNGVEIASDSTVLGATTITKITIGGIGGWGGYSGNIYDVIPIKGALTDAEVQLLEAQAAKAAGGRIVAGVFVSDF